MTCIEALKQPRPTMPSGLPITLVAAVVLVNEAAGEILIAQRPEGKAMAGKWVFPGGKVEEGERPEFVLCRELEEELNIDVRECCLAPLGFTSHPYDDFHLLMPLYVCRMWNGDPEPKEAQVLEWIKPIELSKYDLLEADIPLIYQILDRL